MPIKVNPVVQPSPPAVATYSYVDLASGTGYIVFYPGNSGNIAGDEYFMSNNLFYSQKTLRDEISSGGANALVCAQDFDVLFNLPRIIKGDAIISLPMGVQSPAASQTYQCQPIITLVHVDTGGTPTELAMTSGANWTTAVIDTNVYAYNMANIKVTVPQKHFKKGETLRVHVALLAGGASVGKYFFGHDPQNRASSDYNTEEYPVDATYTPLTWGTDPSICTVQIPFKIDTT